MDSRSFVELKPTWNTQGPYDIHVCLNCDFENEENGSQEETFCNSPHSVVILSTSDQSDPEPCFLQIRCRSGAEVISMAILSNARHAEVHDNIDGYLSTARGQRIQTECREGDDDNDDIIYRKEIKLERSHSSVKLKFVSLADKNLLHLHHIHLTLTKSGSSETPLPLLQGRHGNIDMDHVRGLLSSQQPISERAESLMNTIEQYQKNQSSVVQDLQTAVVESATNQKSGSNDLGMMGQMASLLSGFSRSGTQGQVAASPDVMFKMMSSFGGGGDSAGKESMYGALKIMCRDVTNMRSQEEQDAKNKAKQDQEKSSNEEENTDVPGPSQTSLENHLQSFLSSMEEKMMARLEARLDTLQAHFDLRLNRLETMLTELTTQAAEEANIKVNVQEEEKAAAKEKDPRVNLNKYL